MRLCQRKGLVTMNEIAELIRVLGREKAFLLISQLPISSRGNPYILFPRKIGRDKGQWAQRLVTAVGDELAIRLAEEFGGETWTLPKLEILLHKPFRNAAIRKQFSEGVDVKMIAFIFDISPRQVRNIVGNSA